MAADACRVAENIEFVRSTLGERRLGCEDIEMSAFFSGYDAVVWMFRHTPTNDESEAQLFALAQDLTAPYAHKFGYRNASGWTEVTLIDTPDFTVPNGHRMSAVSLHGKLFLAYNSSVSRLHVWDGSSVRRVGLAESAAPVVSNTGSGSYAGTRYFRVRYTTQVASVTIRRSEPSDATTFNPSGSGSGASVARPALLSEGETHWEVEASLDNANFYRISTQAVGTTSYTDSTAAGTGYATGNTLSEDVGDYTLWPSVRLLSVDEDRLMGAGNWEDEDEESRINWSPVFNNPTGVGNDERLELDTEPSLDLDGYEGGALTALSRGNNGYVYAYKRSHTYRLVRQSRRSNAYTQVCLTKAVGALPGSLVEAIDQAGNPSLYQIDQRQAVYRSGAAGLQWCGRDYTKLWERFNRNALVPCHGVYDSVTRQVHFWLALDDEDYPNAKLIAHVNEMRDSDEGARRGFVTVPVGDVIAAAHCSVMFSDNVDSSDARTLDMVPYIGIEDATDHILRCGVGTDDNGTAYAARVRSKPYMPGGLLQHTEVMAATLLCETIATEGAEISVRAVRDFGVETLTRSTDMAEPDGAEEDVTDVIKPLDSFSLSEGFAFQFEIGDLEDEFTPSEWAVNALVCKTTGGTKA